MPTRPFVSVIICTRNRAASLARTLDSIVVAARHICDPWELLVVDNGSTDSTAATIDNFIEKLPFGAFGRLSQVYQMPEIREWLRPPAHTFSGRTMTSWQTNNGLPLGFRLSAHFPMKLSSADVQCLDTKNRMSHGSRRMRNDLRAFLQYATPPNGRV